jgi:hypothetical protein
MATAGTVLRESSGSLTLHIIPLTTVATSDTYSSGIPGVVGYYATITSGTTIASVTSANPIQISESNGTFTFTGGKLVGTASNLTLFVLSKS